MTRYTRILDGCLIIIDRAIEATHGDIVLAVIDGEMTCKELDSRYGAGTLHSGAEGFTKKWYMRQNFTSPCYTTRWQDIPVIKC